MLVLKGLGELHLQLASHVPDVVSSLDPSPP
jgi:hypothetical protein